MESFYGGRTGGSFNLQMIEIYADAEKKAIDWKTITETELSSIIKTAVASLDYGTYFYISNMPETYADYGWMYIVDFNGTTNYSKVCKICGPSGIAEIAYDDSVVEGGDKVVSVPIMINETSEKTTQYGVMPIKLEDRNLTYGNIVFYETFKPSYIFAHTYTESTATLEFTIEGNNNDNNEQ